MYDRILVPVDGSEYADQMIPYAAALARKTGAKLALLRVAFDQSEREEDLASVSERAASVGAEGLCVVTAGEVAPSIRAEAERVPGTLVAMSSLGRTGVAEALFGSVALDIVRESRQPVLVRRPSRSRDEPDTAIGRIVLPLDGSRESETMIADAANFAKWIGAQLVIVSVLDPKLEIDRGIPAADVQESSYIRSHARDIKARYGIDTSWEVLHGEPKDAIPRFVSGLGDAMLAMTTHGRSGLRAVVTGSVTAACLRETGVPVLMRTP
ncbi:MAG: universal stress protein [Burkholderiaceae bacterium]